jgi:hypothetical protein
LFTSAGNVVAFPLSIFLVVSQTRLSHYGYNGDMEFTLLGLQESVQSFNLLVALGVMLAYFIVDAMYAHYTLSVAELKAISAANTGALMHFLLALGVLSYVQNYLYIIPIAIGSWFGTYVIVNMEKGKRET